MKDVIPIASFRTRLEAELAARLLEGAAVPYVMNSSEGMLHGPLADGTTLLVRAEDVQLAREILDTRDGTGGPVRVTRIASCPTREAAVRVCDALRHAGVSALSSHHPGPDQEGRHAVYVPTPHATRARRVIQTAMLDI